MDILSPQDMFDSDVRSLVMTWGFLKSHDMNLDDNQRKDLEKMSKELREYLDGE